MSINFDLLDRPLRFEKGSHRAGEGEGEACGMEFISLITGSVLTDYPECAARPLARLVQGVNDMLGDDDGYLSQANSALVLELGWATIGTAAVADSMKWQWISDLLIHPDHGVVKYARPDGVDAIRRVAELLATKAGGGAVTADEWRAARNAAIEARRAAAADADADAAAYAAAAAAAAAYAAADADAYAAAYAAAAAAAARRKARIEFARWAIQHWRDLAGLGKPHAFDYDDINHALNKIGASA